MEKFVSEIGENVTITNRSQLLSIASKENKVT